MSRERRIQPRTDTRIRTTFRCGGAAIEGVVENIGAGGVFFSTGELESGVQVGAAVTISLHLDDGQTSDMTGSVLRVDRYFDGAEVRRSFAVKFDADLDVASLGVGA